MKNSSVVKYTGELSAEWDDFVINHSRNGGIFHEQKFLSYHPEDRFTDESVLFYSDKKLLAVFPGAEVIDKEGKRRVVSHPGSSAGGIVFRKKAALREVLSILEQAILYYRDKGFYSMEFRLAEPIFSSCTDSELSYLLWHRGFRIKTREISSCVQLAGDNNWIAMGHERNVRYVRSFAKNGIKIELMDSPDAIYRIIENNLLNRYHKRPTHTLDELKDLKTKYPNRIHFWAVSDKDKILAAAVIFEVNKFALHDFYHAIDFEYAKTHALTYLLYSIFDKYKQDGFQWFNYGISSREELIKWNILEYKESVGGRATFRENWILENIQSYQCCI